MPQIRALRVADASAALPALAALLQATVAAGASVGFHPPLCEEAAVEYWRSVLLEVEDGGRVLLGGFAGGVLVATVQLALERRANGRHRAEVQKLMVLPEARRSGIGSKLMAAVEDAARAHGCTLLLLDTREGDAAERLYRRLGWCEGGRIPGYTREPDGSEHATLFFYRGLLPAPRAETDPR